MTKTNITPEMSDAFQAMTSGVFNNFCLMSCFMNGEPTSAICVADEAPDGMVRVTPLFVAVTPSMTLTDHEGRQA